MAGEQDRIGKNARQAIAGNDVLVSAVVVWEVAIKRQLGKLDAPVDLLERLEAAAVGLLSVTARHADRVATLPLHHRDPFDRLLAAQAITEGFPLVTADGELHPYEVEVVW